METDFNIKLPVTDLAIEDAFGEWIVKVMQIILNISKEKIVGPRPGRVSIIFQSDDQNRGVNFYIDQYQAIPGIAYTLEPRGNLSGLKNFSINSNFR